MTRKAKMTDSKPVVTMDAQDEVYLDGWWIGHIYSEHMNVRKHHIDLCTPTTLFTAAQLHAIADFLDQVNGADLLSQVTP